MRAGPNADRQMDHWGHSERQQSCSSILWRVAGVNCWEYVSTSLTSAQDFSILWSRVAPRYKWIPIVPGNVLIYIAGDFLVSGSDVSRISDVKRQDWIWSLWSHRHPMRRWIRYFNTGAGWKNGGCIGWCYCGQCYCSSVWEVRTGGSRADRRVCTQHESGCAAKRLKAVTECHRPTLRQLSINRQFSIAGQDLTFQVVNSMIFKQASKCETPGCTGSSS